VRPAREALRALELPGAPGDAEARAGRTGAASRLRRASRLTADLAARLLGDQVAALAHRAGISLDDDAGSRAAPEANGGGRGQQPSTPALSLTSREYEVLRLVAAGRSNREIAATLFISPKTASVHVSNILGKLGAASRTEAAARAHALRLLDELPARGGITTASRQ
jgi:DNA-binding NarL/FixJ family response regulator